MIYFMFLCCVLYTNSKHFSTQMSHISSTDSQAAASLKVPHPFQKTDSKVPWIFQYFSYVSKDIVSQRFSTSIPQEFLKHAIPI